MAETSSEAAVQVVDAWHAALNQGDLARLVALSAAEIELGGPRGSGRGCQLLREWVERARIRLEPRRIVPRAGAVVVEQEATWEEADPGPPALVASVFVVRAGRVVSVIRYDDLDAALLATEPETESGSRAS